MMEAQRQNRMEQTILGEFLSLANLIALDSCSENIHLRQGEYLFREGQANNRVYVLLDGQLDLTMTIPGRGAKRIMTLGPGDLVAWSALLGEGIMTCSAVCVENAQLIAIDSTSISKMIESDPRFGVEFMEMLASALAKRLLATRLQMLDLFASNT